MYPEACGKLLNYSRQSGEKMFTLKILCIPFKKIQRFMCTILLPFTIRMASTKLSFVNCRSLVFEKSKVTNGQIYRQTVNRQSI